MKEIRILLGALLLLVLAGVSTLISQEKTPPQPLHNHAYDQNTLEKVEGLVVDARDYNCPVSGTVGSHITVKGEGRDIEVHLAPASFMQRYEIAIRKNDKVTVFGSRITFEGKPALIARSVVIGRDTFNFRDNNGRPLW
ncbi:MAG TPA: hypothetical protein VFF39_11065 [Verrucomicrobiae bacterium]|jgi:hypothetical protein|nr:hypothetical protein [Verrucomicrobiae bacterium]